MNSLYLSISKKLDLLRLKYILFLLFIVLLLISHTNALLSLHSIHSLKKYHHTHCVPLHISKSRENIPCHFINLPNKMISSRNDRIQQNNDHSQNPSSLYDPHPHPQNQMNMVLHASSSKNEISSTEVLSNEDLMFKEDLHKCLLWVLASMGFALIIGATKGINSAVEFASGYVLEQSLSVDNLFVFLILFDYFNVPKDKQDRVLTYGLGVAILLRGLFIGVGFVAIEEFHNVLLLFAGILLYSSYKILFTGDNEEKEDMSENSVVKFSQKFLKTSSKFDGDRFFTYENGVKLATPLFLCLLCVEFSDVIFAMDSVPAVFGVTKDPFIVFTSNIFAIASLRSVYGVLSKAVEQLEYLEKAVGVVLGIIALKMASEVLGYSLLTPLQSLLVVLSVLGTGVAASLLKAKTNPILENNSMTTSNKNNRQ